MECSLYRYFYQGKSIALIVMLTCSVWGFGQAPGGIQHAVVNVRTLCNVWTQPSLSDELTVANSMPEQEHAPTHAPATDRIHYPKNLAAAFSTGNPSPTATKGFAARAYDTFYPPDPHGAVNENNVASVVNNELYIQDRDGNLIVDMPLQTFWSALPQATNLFDPRLEYDPNTRRWLIVTATHSNASNSSILFGMSQTDDPDGMWNIYQIKTDSASILWGDYPSIGFSNNWVAVTVNLFGIGADTSSIGRLFLFDKSDMMNGLTPRMTFFGTDQGVVPAATYDTTVSDFYFMETYSESAGQLALLKVSGSTGSPTLSIVGYPAVNEPWAYEPDNGADFGPQLGTTTRIQCNDDRMGSVLVKNKHIWCAHTIFLPAATAPMRSSVQWWDVDTDAEVREHGLIDDPSGTNFYAFPSIAVNKYNDALIGYAVFSAGQYPSCGYSYHDHSQPGAVNNPVIAKYGDTIYYRSASNRNRWGDCTATVVDPVNDVDFWTVQEYADNGSSRWATWWANVAGSDSFEQDPAALGVFIAPNPNNGHIGFYMPEQVNTPVTIEIYNLLGQSIYNNTSETALNPVSVNISPPEGVYTTRISVNGATVDRRFVVHY